MAGTHSYRSHVNSLSLSLYIHTCIHACMHTYIIHSLNYVYIHTCINHTSTYPYRHTYVRADISAYTAHLQSDVCILMYVYIYIYIYLPVLYSIYIYVRLGCGTETKTLRLRKCYSPAMPEGLLRSSTLDSSGVRRTLTSTPCCLVGNGGMDSYDSPLRE